MTTEFRIVNSKITYSMDVRKINYTTYYSYKDLQRTIKSFVLYIYDKNTIKKF